MTITTINLTGTDLRHMLATTAFTATSKDYSPVLENVALSFQDVESSKETGEYIIDVLATDRFTMLHVNLSSVPDADRAHGLPNTVVDERLFDKPVQLPADFFKAVKEVTRTKATDPQHFTLTFDLDNTTGFNGTTHNPSGIWSITAPNGTTSSGPLGQNTGQYPNVNGMLRLYKWEGTTSRLSPMAGAFNASLLARLAKADTLARKGKGEYWAFGTMSKDTDKPTATFASTWARALIMPINNNSSTEFNGYYLP